MNYYAIPGVTLQENKISDISIINRVVAHVFLVDPEKLKERTRVQTIVVPRQVAMYMARKYTRWTYAAIGAFYGLDHSTAIHAVKSAQNIIDIDDYIYGEKVRRVDYLMKINTERYGRKDGCETRQTA